MFLQSQYINFDAKFRYDIWNFDKHNTWESCIATSMMDMKFVQLI